MPNSSAIELWRSQAETLESYQAPSGPLDVLIGESADVAKFAREFWEPAGTRPGLRLAGAKLPVTIADDINSLREAVQDAQTAYRLAKVPRESHQTLLERGALVLAELVATLEWTFDDGVEDEVEHQLQTLSDVHRKNTGSADRLAQALSDYGTLAKPHAQALEGVGGFNTAMINEAIELSKNLGDVNQNPTGAGKDERAALELRNRLAHLLYQRVNLVRRAARFVFRGYPSIVRQVTSAYQRRKRAAHRRAQVGKRAEGGS